jgi:hypothetical protein
MVCGGVVFGQSASRTVVNGEMSLRRLKLSIYEVVKPRGGGGGRGGGGREEEEGGVVSKVL